MEMLKQLFLTICEMSMTAVFVIFLVILVRQFLKKSYKSFSYYLWSIVGFRLLCPISFTSLFSLYNLPFVQKAVESGSKIEWQEIAGYQSGANYWIEDGALSSTNTAPMGEVTAISSSEPTWTFQKIEILAIIWMIGCVVFLGCQLYAYLKLSKKLEMAVRMEDMVYECDKIEEPFVLGIFRARIYLPFHLGAKEREYILAHERYHIKRHDPQIKLLAIFLLALHWFNPLVWAAYYLMCKDMEMSCDERVLVRLGNGIKKDYSTLLLDFAVRKRTLALGTLAFGETSVGERVKNILQFEKPEKRLVILSVAVCAVVFLFGIANGNSENTIRNVTDDNSTSEEYEYQLSRDMESVLIYSEYYRYGKMEDYEILFCEEVGENLWKQKGTFSISNGYVYDDEGSWSLNGSLNVNGKSQMFCFPLEIYGYRQSLATFYQGDGRNKSVEAEEDLILAAFQLARANTEITPFSSESFQDYDSKYAALSQNPDVILYHVIFSEKSAKELLAEYQIPTTIKELYAVKNPYIGDHVADGKVLRVSMPRIWDYQMELHTSEEPYGITLHFQNYKLENNEVFREKMLESGAIFLAVTENAGFFEWSYETEDGTRSERYDVEDMERVFDISDLKSYAVSEETLMELVKLVKSSSFN